MESYIEITWITSFLMLLQAGTLAFYLAGKPCAFYKIILYSACIPFVACFVFGRYEWLCMAGVEGLFFYWIYRDNWKGWLLMIAHRLLLNLTCYIFFEGTFHLGIFFVPCTTIPYVFWILLIGVWMGMFFHWKQTLSQQSFIYPLELRTSKACIKVKGYLDSGNLMMQEGLPVLFLDQTYQEYFENENIEWVVMNTMQGAAQVRCFQANARIGNTPYHRVLVHFNRQLSLPFGAKALLNIHMITQE